MNNIERILVCITIQENSKRLIDKGSELAAETHGELHILHVEQGTSIFENEKSVVLLEELFEHGKRLGGEVHFVSSELVPEKIVACIRELEISQVVMGQSDCNVFHKILGKDIYSSVLNETQGIEVMVIDRMANKSHKTGAFDTKIQEDKQVSLPV